MNKNKKIVLITAGIIFLILICVSLFFIVGHSSKKEVCTSFSITECPNSCVVCPPCEVCSSLSCQSEEFCTSLGFNRSWYEAIERKLGN